MHQLRQKGFGRAVHMRRGWNHLAHAQVPVLRLVYIGAALMNQEVKQAIYDLAEFIAKRQHSGYVQDDVHCYQRAITSAIEKAGFADRKPGVQT